MDGRASGLQRVCVCVWVCTRTCVHWAPPVTESREGRWTGGLLVFSVCVCGCVCVHTHVRALGSTRDREQGGKVAGGQMSCWKPLEGGGDPGLGSEGGVGWISRTAGTSLVATA